MSGKNRPPASSPAVSQRMSTYPRRDTKPELRLRRELHLRGLRYRVDQPIPGMPRRRADLTFARAKVVIFVDGCYWHGCPIHFRPAGLNREWWERKIRANRERDRDTEQRLAEEGWAVRRFWEHDDMFLAADEVQDLVTRRVAGIRKASRNKRGEHSGPIRH